MLATRTPVLVSRHIDRGDEAVATSGDVDDEPMPVAAIAQRATQCGHVDRQVGRLDEDIGPNARHQLLLADQLTAAFNQSNQDLQSPTPERYGRVALPQEKLRRKQAERSERYFGRSGAGRSSSVLGEWLVRITSLNGPSYVKSRFGI